MVTSSVWDMIHGSLNEADFSRPTLTKEQIDLLEEFGIPANEVYEITKPSINPIVWYYEGYIYPINFFREYLSMMRFQERVNVIRMEMNEYKKEKNWSSFFGMCDKRMIISQFIKYHKEIAPEEVYEVFIDIWTRAENGFDLFTPQVLQYVFEQRFFSSEWKERMQEYDLIVKYKKKVRIYHGEQNNGYNVGDLCSWTLSKKVAQFFADRFANKLGKVYWMDISPKDSIVIDYLNNRNEKEVLILPTQWYAPMGETK